MAYAGPGKEVYTNIVPLTVHSVGGSFSLVKELRGSEIPDRVEAILIVGADTAKSAIRNITVYTGEGSTSLSSGKSPRTPVLQRTQQVGRKGGMVFSKIPEDTSLRFNNSNIPYGIY